MQSKIVILLIMMLSFSTFHDSFFPLIEKHEHSYVVNDLDGSTTSTECSEFNEIHSMLHFMAIIQDDLSRQIEVSKKHTIPHLTIQYSPPYQQVSNKPPIV